MLFTSLLVNCSFYNYIKFSPARNEEYLKVKLFEIFMVHLFTVPNMLSFVRLVFVPVLYVLLLWGRNTVVLMLLLLVGFTDVLDGFLARRWKQTSKLGTALDSVADYTYYAFFAAWVFLAWPVQMKLFTPLLLVPLVIIAGAYAIMLMRFQTICFLHLYSSKLTGVAAFVFLVSTLLQGFNSVFLTVVISLWLLTALEMLAASIVLEKPRSNIKSVVVV